MNTINDIREYVEGVRDHYRIMRTHEAWSSYDEEMFENMEDVAQDILEYIDKICKCQ